MATEIKIKTEDPPMAEALPSHRRIEGKKDDTVERLARFAANRLEHERLKREVERAKEAKKEALRLKLEKEELEDKRIQEEIQRMKAELEELNQPSPNNTTEHATEEEHGNPVEQVTTEPAQVANGHGQVTPDNTQERSDSRHVNGLSEDVENLITQEARKGQSPNLPRSEATRSQNNGIGEAQTVTRHKTTGSGETSKSGSLFVGDSYDSSDEILRNHFLASVDGSNRGRLAEYLKECEKFFKSKATWSTKKQIEFAMLHLVGALLTSWRESAIKLKSPTWEDYKIALFKANTRLEGPQTHSCKSCGATFGSEASVSRHLSQSRPCRPMLSPQSPTAKKTIRPPNGIGVVQNGTSGSETKLLSHRKSINCSQCHLPFPSTDDLGRHRDATGHTILSPSQPKATLIRTPTGPKNPETASSLANPSSQSTNTCSACNISFRNHHDLVQHLHNSGHMTAKEPQSPPAANPMGAPAHSNSIKKRNSYNNIVNNVERGSPVPDSHELDRRTCRTCKRVYPTRVEMHEHLRESGHAVPTFPVKHSRSHPNPFPEPNLSLYQRTSGGSSGGYGGAQHYSSSQDEDYIGLGPSSDSPTRSRSYKDPQRTCEKCDTEFPSRIEMFEHIREANHVIPRKRIWQGRYEDDGGLGGRVSVVRRWTDY